jgi:hypothetical protein
MSQRRYANGLSREMISWLAAGRNADCPALAVSQPSTLANRHLQPLCRRLNHHPAPLSSHRSNPTPANTLIANRSPAIKSP